jgi:hypothetical protein
MYKLVWYRPWPQYYILLYKQAPPINLQYFHSLLQLIKNRTQEWYTDKYQLISDLLKSLQYDTHFAEATARNYI